MTDPFSSPGAGGARRGGRGGSRRPGQQRDKPRWPFTSVGAHPVTTGNVVSGDMSQEELRVLAYQQAPQQRGCSQEVIQREASLVAEFQQKNNSAPSQAQNAGSTAGVTGDPFAGGLQRAPQPQSQEPIFGGVSAPAAPGATNGFMGGGANGFAAGGGSGFAMAGGSGFQNPPAAFPPQQPAMAAPGMAAPGMNTTPAASVVPATGAPVFAFQKVPETAPAPGPF